ncbi:SEC-C metal-binding domain-containing protein [Acinetobacter sp. ANC 4973]|uniref:SEC-C metal-binding domain-containing protein n=1 Tax=Acinetobacter sp. ANC 4973 TaxID=1977871 RepID=UPI000A3427E4|nr:SEC-C metal-binding domain-containing protein [Acinetobacter sp. ANC 4973]OTH00364.1 hypothetical protein B9T30_04060 [Acinetobacter sp. ANC 4973]
MKMVQDLELIKKYYELNNNEKLCWCGSDKKFMDCHLNKKSKKLVNAYAIAKTFQKIDKSFKFCLFNSPKDPCIGIIKNAHSISNRLFLSKIEKNNHVHTIEYSLKTNKAEIKNIGINQASTFFGFCDLHDRTLFECFETKEFIYSKEQLFKLAYRSLCLEIFKKKSVEKKYFALKDVIDNGESLEIQFHKQYELNTVIVKNQNSMKTLEQIKQKLNEEIIHTRYDSLSHCLISLKEKQPILASTLISPEYDFNINKIQDLNITSDLNNIFLNSLIINERGYILISWIEKDHLYAKKILDSLFSGDYINKNLLTLIIAYSENFFLPPDFFQLLDSKDQDSFKELSNYHNDYNKLPPKNNIEKEIMIYDSHTYF